MKKSNFWEFLFKFHQMTHAEYENGKDGLKALNTIETIFKDYSQYSYSHQHPIGTRLLRASLQDYEWIIQFATKMKILKSIKGSKEIFSRLDKIDEVYNALAEIEVALKLKMAGLIVSFIERSQQDQTPDILVNHNSTEYNIEITSINAPQHNNDLNDFYFAIFGLLTQFLKDIKIGGTIVKPLKKQEIPQFLQKLRIKVEESLKRDKIIQVNERGYATIHIVPAHMQNTVPNGLLNGFRFVPKIVKKPEDAIIDKIYKKSGQLNYQDRPSILIVYCGTNCWEPEQLFRTQTSDINPIMKTFPDLMGIVLTSHQRWWSSYEIPRKETLNNKILVNLAPAIQESESTIIWKNIQSLTHFPSTIIRAFTDYDKNLKKINITDSKGKKYEILCRSNDADCYSNNSIQR